MKCDIKENNEAYNHGVNSLKEAFMLTGNATKSLRFAINEVQDKYPDLDFDHDSFVNPMVNLMKDKGLIKGDYEFKAKKSPVDKKQKDNTESKIKKATERFEKLDASKKAEMARKMAKKFDEGGVLDRDEIMSMYAEVIGLPSMNEETKATIKEATTDMRDFESIDASIRKLDTEYKKEKEENTLTPEKEIEYQKKLEVFKKDWEKSKVKAAISNQKLSRQIRDNGYFIHDLSDMMNMNVMGIESLVRNLLTGVFDTIPRQVANFIASSTTSAYSYANKKLLGRDVPSAIPLGSRVRGGAKGLPGTLSKIKQAFLTGKTTYNPEIDKYDYVNAYNEFRKIEKEKGLGKVKRALMGALKVTPQFIGRVLNSTDMAFFDPVMMGELNRIAEVKKLEGFEKQMFLLEPDSKSYELALERAKEITYKKKGAALQGLESLLKFDSRAKAAEAIKNGASPVLANYTWGLYKMASTMVFPFITTPVNIFKQTLEYVVPEYTFTKGLIKSLSHKEMSPEERQRIFADAASKAVVGMYMRKVAFQLVAMGAISAGYSDEEKEVMDAIEKKAGGPNRVNLNSLVRALFMLDPTEQKGDVYVNLNSLGLIGTTLGAYAHSFNGMTKEEKEALTEANLLDVSNSVKAGVSSITSALDNTFLSGANQILTVMREPDSKNVDRYGVSAISTLLTSVYPAMLQKLSEATEAERKKVFDKDKTFHENLFNSLGYKFAYNSADLKNKYFNIAESEGAVTKKRDYLLFDNYLGRALANTITPIDTKEVKLDSPINKLFIESQKLEKKDRDNLFPKSVDRKINFTESGRRRKSDAVYEVELNDDQFDYYQKMSSITRMMSATPFITSEDFDNTTTENKVKLLSDIYEKSREEAIKMTVEKYPELINDKNIKEKVKNTDLKTLKKKYSK